MPNKEMHSIFSTMHLIWNYSFFHPVESKNGRASGIGCHGYLALKCCASALPVKYTVHASTTTAPVNFTALTAL